MKEVMIRTVTFMTWIVMSVAMTDEIAAVIVSGPTPSAKTSETTFKPTPYPTISPAPSKTMKPSVSQSPTTTPVASTPPTTTGGGGSSMPPSTSTRPSMLPTSSHAPTVSSAPTTSTKVSTAPTTATGSSSRPSVAPSNPPSMIGTSSAPSKSPTMNPTTSKPTTSPPTMKPVPPPTMKPTASPTKKKDRKKNDSDKKKEGFSFWRMLGKTIAWLFILALSVLAFGFLMTHRYRIYYHAKRLYFQILRWQGTQCLIRTVVHSPPGRWLGLEGRFDYQGYESSLLNEVVFEYDQMDDNGGLLLQDI